jgi:hypothetical protein
MSLNIDFAGVEAMDLSPVPAGTYECEVVQCKQQKASTGKPMLVWAFKILDEGFVGRRVFLNTVLSGDARWKLKQTLMGLGFTEEDLAADFDLDPQEMIGLTCYVVVTQSLYQGAVKNDVQRVIDTDAYEAALADAEPTYEDIEVEDAFGDAGDVTEDELEEAIEAAMEDEEDTPEPPKITKAAQRRIDLYEIPIEELETSASNTIGKAQVDAWIAANVEEDDEE